VANLDCAAVRLVMAHGVLSATMGGRHRPVSRLEPWFALGRPEGAFARALLSAATQYWLFRTHQGRRCGDFIALDRSAANTSSARCFAIELKHATPLRFWWRGMQLLEYEAAAGYLAGHGCQVTTTVPVVGDAASVLRLLRGHVAVPSQT
jgi:hypothetical protein